MLHFAKRAMIAVGLGAMALTGAAATAQPGPGMGPDRHDRGPDRDRPGGPGRPGPGRPGGPGWNGPGGPGWNRPGGSGRHDDWRSRDRNWRNWRQYDYNRFERGGGGYYAENYYRGGYRPIRVTRETRIYRGYNGNYYCRRSDGTTGLIVGAALGGVIGNQLDRGGSNLLGTILGAGVGGALGSSIDRGSVTCR